MIPKYCIVSYIRNNKGRPVGMLVAVKNDDGYGIGYSLCCKHDRFCKKMGLKIAIGRANSKTESLEKRWLPHPVRRALPDFTSRCQSYYRNRNERPFLTTPMEFRTEERR